MKIYMLKLTDEDHTLIKVTAANMGLTMKELIVRAVYELVEKGKKCI